MVLQKLARLSCADSQRHRGQSWRAETNTGPGRARPCHLGSLPTVYAPLMTSPTPWGSPLQARQSDPRASKFAAAWLRNPAVLLREHQQAKLVPSSRANPQDLQAASGNIALFPTFLRIPSSPALAVLQVCSSCLVPPFSLLFLCSLLSISGFPENLGSWKVILEHVPTHRPLRLLRLLRQLVPPFFFALLSPWNPIPLMSRILRSLALCLCLVWCLGK